MMKTELKIGAKIREVDTGWTYEIISLQGYMNYGVGIERVGIENTDTEYIKESEIESDYKLIT